MFPVRNIHKVSAPQDDVDCKRMHPIPLNIEKFCLRIMLTKPGVHGAPCLEEAPGTFAKSLQAPSLVFQEPTLERVKELRISSSSRCNF